MTNKKQQDELRNPGHSFDGIEEYDNDMPSWWLNMFYVSVVFGVAYMAWYHLPFFDSKSLQEEYEEAAAAVSVSAEEIRQAQAEAAASFSLETAVQDAALVAQGEKVYATNCASCHAASGEGLVGPNLTDGFWVHGSSFEEVSRVVAEGIPAKGMPAWEKIVGPDGVQAVVVFLKTLEGKGEGKPNAKPPEGEPGTLQ